MTKPASLLYIDDYKEPGLRHVLSPSVALNMEPAEGVPMMRLLMGVNADRTTVKRASDLGFTTLVHINSTRPVNCQFAVVETAAGETWIVDLYDLRMSADTMTLYLGRYLTIPHADAALAALAFGW